MAYHTLCGSKAGAVGYVNRNAIDIVGTGAPMVEAQFLSTGLSLTSISIIDYLYPFVDGTGQCLHGH